MNHANDNNIYIFTHFLKVLNKMREIIGFHQGDSILAPGGSISNMYALIIARHRYYPNHKHHGMRAIKEHLVVYTSEEVIFILFIILKLNILCTFMLFYETNLVIFVVYFKHQR